MDILSPTTAFAALGQQTRLDVLRLLIQAGERGLLSGEIGDRLDVRQNTMSANLAVLLHAKLVRRERHGRTIRYFADFATLRDLLGFLMQDCCGGKPKLCQPIIEKIVCCPRGPAP